MKITGRRVFQLSVILLALLIAADIAYFGYLEYLRHESSVSGGQKLGDILVSPSPRRFWSPIKLLILLIHSFFFSLVLMQIGFFIKAKYYAAKNIPVLLMDLITHRYFLRSTLFVSIVIALVSFGEGVVLCDQFFPFRSELRKMQEWFFWGLVWGLPFLIFIGFYGIEKKHLVNKIGKRGFYNTGHAISNANFFAHALHLFIHPIDVDDLGLLDDFYRG